MSMEEARQFGNNPLEYALAKQNAPMELRGSSYQNPYMENNQNQSQIYRDESVSTTVQTPQELEATGFMRAQPELDPTGSYKAQVIKEQQDLVTKNLELPEEPLYSKLRSSGLSKEESIKETKISFARLVASGTSPEEAHKKVFGDGRVQWNRENMNKRLEIVDKVNTMSAKLGSINISMEDIISGNLSEESTKILKDVGDYGLQTGLFESYDISRGVGYTPDGIPIKLNDGGILDIMEASKYELAGGISLSILAPLMTKPGTAVPALGVALAADMVGSYWGRAADIIENEQYLESQGMDIDNMSTFDLHREGAISAVTTGALAKSVEFMISKGTAMSSKLYQSILGRDEEGAIKHISGLVSLERPELEKRAKEYSKVMGLDFDSMSRSKQNKLILQNEITNNPSLQGYLTKITSENSDIAGALSKTVKDRTNALSTLGTKTTSGDMIKMFEDTKKEVSKMMGTVRGSLDEMFDGTELPVEQLRFQANKIREGLQPFIATVEERNARSSLDKLNVSLSILEQSPSMGNLFKARTDFGSLLRKIGMFDELPATRSKKLGTVDTETLSSTYKTIDDHINNIIKSTPYLNDAQRKTLLDLKNTSDKLYSQYSKAINTSFAKGLYSESATSKASLDNLIKLGVENKSQYDDVMEAMTKTNQDSLEQAMVRRALDKVRIDGSYVITNAIEDLSKLAPKLKNSQTKTNAESIVKAANIFQQDPIIRAVSAHRPVSAKLKSAGLTYNPMSSLMYSNWSSAYPGVQVAMVNVLNSLPVVNKMANVLPLYRTIKGSAIEINAYNSAVRAFKATTKNADGSSRQLLGDFKDFLDKLGKIEGLPTNARRSVATLSRQYAKLAQDMEANFNESRAFMDAVDKDYRFNGPMPAVADPKYIERVRNNSEMRAIQLVEQAEAAMNRNISIEIDTLTTLRNSNISAVEKNKIDKALNVLKSINTHRTSFDDLKPLVDESLELSRTIRRGINPDYRIGTVNSDIIADSFSTNGFKDVKVIKVGTSNNFRVNIGEESLSLSINNGYMSATTLGLIRNSGSGSKAYFSIFDLAERVGIPYKASSALSDINTYRTTINELRYLASRGEDSTNILLNKSQRGVPTNLDGKPLTMENGKVLMLHMQKEINRLLPEGVRIYPHSTDEELVEVILKHKAKMKDSGNSPIFGINTARLIRNFKATGNIMLGASMLYLMLDDDYISSKLGES